MTVVIVDYGSGNLRSAAKAFERSAADLGRDRVVVSADAEVLADASHIVLPGVGAFADCLAGLNAVPGMREALDEQVVGAGKPFLGICVGMQLMAARGREHGVHRGLGWIAGEVVPLRPRDASFKIPHMGWNELALHRHHPILDGIGDGDHAYFVHGYHMVCEDPATVIATSDHGQTFAAVVGRDNLVGTQFHPEKSQAIGLRLIANFLRWRP